MTLQVLGIFFCGLWICASVYLQRSAAHMPLLRDSAGLANAGDLRWPLVSVIVPACNEQQHIAEALESLLAQDYPALDLIVVDDRSKDATGEIVDRLAETDDRLRVIHIESLPVGWLGKVHAMQRGVELARGEWLLFTDADVRFEPQTLKQAVGLAKSQGVEHLTCLPAISWSRKFWLDVTVRAFFMLFAVTMRLAAVNRENSRWPVGIGAFNLVKADAFRCTPGFEWLRMEPADDLGLGVMLKNAGARTRLVDGDRMISVPWYGSIGEMIRGLEKNSFGPAANYKFLRQCLMVVLLTGFACMPILSIVLGLARLDAILLAAGAAASLSLVIVAVLMSRRSRWELLTWLFVPVGVSIMSWIMLRSAWLCRRNDGIDWRGTHYSIAELRTGQRVSFTDAFGRRR